MRLFDMDSLKEILETLSKNKSRTLLTGFGVFWGVFMLLMMSGGGSGLKQLLSRNFEGFATNSILVVADRTTKPYKGFNRGRTWNFTLDDVDYLKAAIPELDVVAPVNAMWGRNATYNGRSCSGTIKGLSADYRVIEAPSIEYGRYISEADILSGRKVCVIGKRIYEELFPEGGNPCGNFIKIDGTYYQVVGLDVSNGQMSINGNSSETIVIPINVFMSVYNNGNNVGLLAMTVRSGSESSVIQEDVRQALYRRHLVSPDDKSAMFVMNTGQMFAMVDNLFRGVNILIWLVGLGTLLAGAIGGSNIMMVTVKERTTEIGIRRAIGATPRMILGQIMSESVILTLSSGAIALVISVAILSLVDMVMAEQKIECSFQVGFGTALITAVTLSVLGIVAGLAPAFRAMAIKPVDAMRDE